MPTAEDDIGIEPNWIQVFVYALVDAEQGGSIDFRNQPAIFRNANESL